MNKHKFALVGTSCSGKTTLTYGLVSRLKSYGLLADGVFNQDRKFSFDRKLIESSELAQNWMVNNLIAKEIDTGLHSDVDILLSDRSAIDLYGYYHYQYPDSGLCTALGHYVREWAQTYDALYYLEPLPYHDDNKRPDEGFRTNVDKHLIENVLPYFPNVKYLPRSDILNDILLTVKFVKPNVKSGLTLDDIKTLSKSIKEYVVYKPKDLLKTDPLSDYDIYIHAPNPLDEVLLETYRTYIKGLFGPFVNIDLHLTNTIESFSDKFSVIYPEIL